MRDTVSIFTILEVTDSCAGLNDTKKTDATKLQITFEFVASVWEI